MIVETHNLTPGPQPYSQQIYNGLDCCLTFEIMESLESLHNQPPEIYQFELALQAPALEMMLRGFKIDQFERQTGMAFLRGEIEKLDLILQRFAFAVWGKSLNPRSPKQLIDFFYKTMKLPEKWISKKGVKKLSMDRETLEALELYFHARPIIACILAIRDYSKQLSTLETDIDSDGRMRTSYNIAGTETGRWSSSKSSEQTGTNLQNISPKLRKMFIADPGWKICGIDLEQAESREVGWLCGTLFNEWTYLDACYAGDLHTTTAKLVWPGLGWQDNPKLDRSLADQIYYRDFSYRDLSKRGGHGTSYYGTPFTMARHLKVPTKIMEDFQLAFFHAYPGIRRYHRWVAQQLQTTQCLTSVFGRTRHFFGRPNDDTTLREAIAYLPQSATADRLNLIMWRVWKYMPQVRLLAQVHDALYFMYQAEEEQEVITKALSLFDIPISCGTRTLKVPGEAKIGWNWASFDPKFNPNGLMKWKGSDSRVRLSGLDRVL